MALRTPFRTFTTMSGRTFAVRVLPTGARYGLNNCLTNDDGAIVEFYDTTYADDGEFGPLGQFVSRYLLRNLREGSPSGLNLYGGEPVWTIDAQTMRTIRVWLTQFPN